MDEIAARAGVSRQAVYLHFGTRAGLLVELAAHVDQRQGLGSGIEHVEAAPNAVEALDRLVQWRATYTPRIYELATMIDAARRFDRDAGESWRNRMQLRHAHSAIVAQRLQREGRLRAGWTAADAADLIWALTSIRTYEDLVVDRGWTLPRYTRHMKATLKRALVAGATRIRTPVPPAGRNGSDRRSSVASDAAKLRRRATEDSNL